MKAISKFTIMASSLLLFSCAAPPKTDASKVNLVCSQQCSTNLTTCSSGFKLFPVIAQQQCNDNYDVCIKACPERILDVPVNKSTQQDITERFKRLDELLKLGTISKDEYDRKRKEIINSL